MANKKTDSIDGTGKKTRRSIVFKLNRQFASRLFAAFLAIDAILCVAAVASMAYLSELKAEKAAGILLATGMPQESAQRWLEASGCRVTPLAQEPDGWKIPFIFRDAFPEDTASASRRFEVASSVGSGFSEKLDGLVYHITVTSDGLYYDIAIGFFPFIKLFRNAMYVLFAVQALMLFQCFFSGSRMVRETLSPIAELAEAAKNLNTPENAFSPEKMRALTGKLDGINAAKLDTRISVDGTQDELKNLAAAINGMLDRINESYRAQVRFVSDASHELRTPIAVIQGYANLLDRWGKNDEKTLQESIDAIKDEADNMKALIEQLLFLARGDNNTIVLQLEQFDLSELAAETLKETQMIDKGHQYESHFSPVLVTADKALIKQAMRILLDNAIKYTGTSGKIIVSVSKADAYAKLTVQDDGIGIPEEAVPRIFDRFYRADESRARATGGTGLGLSIAKWITERHSGHLEVLSRRDIGTRISVVLPLPNENGDALMEKKVADGNGACIQTQH